MREKVERRDVRCECRGDGKRGFRNGNTEDAVKAEDFFTPATG